MNFKIVNLPFKEKSKKADILIIYTGGTLGMVKAPNGSLVPFNFRNIVKRIPQINALGLALTVISFPKPLDSSNIEQKHWKDMAYIIEENYKNYDGFLILHGTDTMAYSASALSFMLTGLQKPVIFTGAQIPIGEPRNDARENLITSLIIASDRVDDEPKVKEVCIFFDNVLLRGNRASKVESAYFNAFHSENYPVLAEAGLDIIYNESALAKPKQSEKLQVFQEFESRVWTIRLFPGMPRNIFQQVLKVKDLKGIVLETFGSGNGLLHDWFLNGLKQAIAKGIIILNVSQCHAGRVEDSLYANGLALKEIGVINGKDLTTEAAICKLKFCLGRYQKVAKIREFLAISIAGEMTI